MTLPQVTISALLFLLFQLNFLQEHSNSPSKHEKARCPSVSSKTLPRFCSYTDSIPVREENIAPVSTMRPPQQGGGNQTEASKAPAATRTAQDIKQLMSIDQVVTDTNTASLTNEQSAELSRLRERVEAKEALLKTKRQKLEEKKAKLALQQEVQRHADALAAELHKLQPAINAIEELRQIFGW